MSDLVENERTKLLANALDRASTASLTVGVLAPIAATLYDFSGRVPGPLLLALSALLWLLAAVSLHLLARMLLRGLRE